MSGDDEIKHNRSRRRSRVQLPWETVGHYSDELRRRQAPPEIRAIIDREMGKRRLGGAASAPGLYFSPNANNPYFAIAYGLMFSALPFAIGASQESVALFAWMFLLFGLVGLLLIYLGAARVRRWHKARAAVRAHILVHGGHFPSELHWNR